MLETIAGVPGMIGAMSRHFHSLRKLTRDNGWIHTLLGESLWTNQTVTVPKMTVASDLQPRQRQTNQPQPDEEEKKKTDKQ